MKCAQNFVKQLFIMNYDQGQIKLMVIETKGKE